MTIKKRKKSAKDNEMSKRIFWAFSKGFAVHVFLSMVLIVFEHGEQAIELMKATGGIYMAVVAGYFGKAGVENYQKIKNLAEEMYPGEPNG